MHKKNVLVCENIRSAYNTGVMIRTADGLGRGVCLSGYTPHPDTESKVKKSSLGAEESVGISQYWNTSEAISILKSEGYVLIAMEITDASVSLREIDLGQYDDRSIALIMGNEKMGVLQETLDACDVIVHVPMQGLKESLNVAEAASIGMWELT